MKTLILIFSAVLLIGYSSYGQSDKDVPSKVTSSFSQKFPGASNIKWGKEGDTEWEAEFKMNGRGYSANFDNSGVWTETEYEINKKEIPAAVKSTLDKEYAGYKIEVSEISETKDGKIYEFGLEKDKIEMELAIDANGVVLKKEQIKEEKEDEED